MLFFEPQIWLSKKKQEKKNTQTYIFITWFNTNFSPSNPCYNYWSTLLAYMVALFQPIHSHQRLAWETWKTARRYWQKNTWWYQTWSKFSRSIECSYSESMSVSITEEYSQMLTQKLTFCSGCFINGVIYWPIQHHLGLYSITCYTPPTN